MKIFAARIGVSPPVKHLRNVALGCGALIFAGMSTLLVKAGENPHLWRVMNEFNRPVREAVRSFIQPQREPRPVLERVLLPAETLSYAPGTIRGERLSIGGREPRFERFEIIDPLPLPRAAPRSSDAPQPGARTNARARTALMASSGGAPVAMNYCVRLCDGFAFPVGQAGLGTETQEAACRATCPNAETALYSAPAGAKDFDALSRAGRPYSALPVAFSYREKLTPACTCNAVGASQSSLALLNDATLRPGDLVMTRVGTRHFDGSARRPYRAGQFSDALARLTNKREIAIVRAMETASVRGLIPANASAAFRERVAFGVRQAEKIASASAIEPSPKGHPRGFIELQARDRSGPIPVPTVRRTAGIVALN